MQNADIALCETGMQLAKTKEIWNTCCTELKELEN